MLMQGCVRERAQRRQTATLKLSQATCKLAYKELPACHLASVRAGKTTKRFKLETWKLVHDASFGRLRLTTRELSGASLEANNTLCLILVAALEQGAVSSFYGRGWRQGVTCSKSLS